MNKLIFGKGIYNRGEYSAKIKRKNTFVYQTWCDMLRRCYSEDALVKGPTYKGCTVHKDLLEFQIFAEWATKQIGYGLKDYHMDKDILVEGNKVYSKETIAFVPKDLNVFLTSAAAKRGKFPQGVSWKTSHQRFVSQIKECGIVKHLGLFDTVEEAMQAYKVAKTMAGKLWGERLRAGEFIVDERVVLTMENYDFNYRESVCN